MDDKFDSNKNYYKTFDFKTAKPKKFGSWYEAVAFAQRNGIKNYTVMKVDDHYEIH